MAGRISRNTFILSFVSFFNDVASEMVYPIIPLFLTSVLGASLVCVGVVEGVAECASDLMKLLFGYVSDRVKKSKPFVVLGYLISSVSRPLMGLSGGWKDILVLRSFDRLGKGIRTSPRDKIIFLSQDRKTLGLAFSFQRAMDHMGAVLGPVAAFFLLGLPSVSFRMLFYLSAIPAAIILFLTLLVRDVEAVPQVKTPDVELKKASGPLDRRIFIYMASLFVFSLGNASDAFLVLLLSQRGFAVSDIPLVWAFFSLSKGALSPLFGWLSDLYGRKRMVVLGWMLYALCYFIFPLNHGRWVMLGIVGLYGCYYAMTEGVEKALLGEMVKSRVGSLYGVFHFTKGMSLFVSSVLFAFLWKAFGVKVAFWFGGALSLIASMLLVVV